MSMISLFLYVNSISLYEQHGAYCVSQIIGTHNNILTKTKGKPLPSFSGA